MKKACKYCGRIHESGYVCRKKPSIQNRRYKTGERQEDAFRWSYAWKTKREDIKKRDRYLCRACLEGLPGTVRRLNQDDLSVHHIISLEEDYSLRLDDENLVTLCRYHHGEAEQGRLAAETLLKIVKNTPPQGQTGVPAEAESTGAGPGLM